MLYGQEVNVKCTVSSEATLDHTCSLKYAKDLHQHASPPWREDDKDGHYKFEVGEDLTSRCNLT